MACLEAVLKLYIPQRATLFWESGLNNMVEGNEPFNSELLINICQYTLNYFLIWLAKSINEFSEFRKVFRLHA